MSDKKSNYLFVILSLIPPSVPPNFIFSGAQELSKIADVVYLSLPVTIGRFDVIKSTFFLARVIQSLYRRKENFLFWEFIRPFPSFYYQ